MADFPLWAAISTVKQGLSTAAGLRAYRAGGGKVTDSTFYKMVNTIKANVAQGVMEPTRPLNQKPRSDEIGLMPVKHPGGYLQNVGVVVRDNVTGITRVRPFSVRNDELMTRADVIATAESVFRANAFGYEETTLGVVYTGTVELVDRELL